AHPRLRNAITTLKFDVDELQYILFLMLCYTDIEYAALAKTFSYGFEGDLSDTALEEFHWETMSSDRDENYLHSMFNRAQTSFHTQDPNVQIAALATQYRIMHDGAMSVWEGSFRKDAPSTKSSPSLSLVADDSGVSTSQGLDHKSAVDHLATVGAPKPPLVFGKGYDFNPSDLMFVWRRVRRHGTALKELQAQMHGCQCRAEDQLGRRKRWTGRNRLPLSPTGAIHGEQDWVE
ncbi:MAG: hypothetical protein L6R36_006673, partial [Xanthoria steineri]